MIICAAIKVIGRDKSHNIVICGHRHYNCFEQIKELGSYWQLCTCEKVQGFINHKGEFLDRVEAYKHALECGQINVHDSEYRRERRIPNELYSEDLY